MASRLELQTILQLYLGNNNVYYQPPETIKLNYPAIIYSKEYIDKMSADDSAYKLTNRYSISVISRSPDEPVIQKLLALPYCSYDRHYVADNLHHDVLTIYF